MNSTDCKPIGQLVGRYVDERARMRPKIGAGPDDAPLSKLDMIRIYVRAARLLGHSQSDQRFHLELIRLSKTSDYALGGRVVLAHSNVFLAKQCGMSRSGLGRQLRRHDGTTLRRSLSGNGHRFVARRRSAAEAGQVVDSFGISLEPLITLMREMQPMIEAQDELQFSLDVEKARIGRDRRRQREALVRLDGELLAKAFVLATDSKALAGAIRSAFASGRLSELQLLGRRVAEIADAIDGMVAIDLATGAMAANVKTAELTLDDVRTWTPQGCEDGHQLHSQRPLESDSVVAVETASEPAGDQVRKRRCRRRKTCWTPLAIRSVFPGLGLYVGVAEPSWRDVMEGADRLARDLGINARCWDKARLSMGAERRVLAVGLVAELLAKGRIRESAGQYFGGMIKKAQIGALDLDRSLWVLRQSLDASEIEHRLPEADERGPHVSP
jgi:replication initiation protein RepC